MRDEATDAVVPWLTLVVVGDSMEPALRAGDRLIARRVDDPTALEPGSVVALRRPDRPELVLVKRLVRRDGDGWWVEGDNAARSDDSRTFGPVPDALVLAEVRARLWPRPGAVRRRL